MQKCVVIEEFPKFIKGFKSKGEKVTQMKKSPANDDWKKDIVDKSLERKQQIGMGNPVDPDQDDIDEDLDIVEPLQQYRPN